MTITRKETFEASKTGEDTPVLVRTRWERTGGVYEWRCVFIFAWTCEGKAFLLTEAQAKKAEENAWEEVRNDLSLL